ncbi:MAG TPA: hypothetical protein VG035_00155, partial [Actinomycetota bacterium]|nr:hypothetical protein [Actinomycetota bacterium]
RARPTALISSWAALLIAAPPWPAAPAENAAHGGLHPPGHPSLWTAYRTDHLTGVARGTWLLILCELSCRTIFGVHSSDPRLITLGFTGVSASALMLARIRRTSRNEPVNSAPARNLR